MRHNTQELVQPYILSISDKNHTLKIKAATLRVIYLNKKQVITLHGVAET